MTGAEVVPMYGLTRATLTLIGAAAAGVLLWLATKIGVLPIIAFVVVSFVAGVYLGGRQARGVFRREGLAVHASYSRSFSSPGA